MKVRNKHWTILSAMICGSIFSSTQSGEIFAFEINIFLVLTFYLCLYGI